MRRRLADRRRRELAPEPVAVCDVQGQGFPQGAKEFSGCPRIMPVAFELGSERCLALYVFLAQGNVPLGHGEVIFNECAIHRTYNTAAKAPFRDVSREAKR